MIAFLLLLVLAVGMFPSSALAAPTLEEALGEVDIINGGEEMSYLAMNGMIRTQRYTYYNFESSDGTTKEIPAYCLTPEIPGVPDFVVPGESIVYNASERASDPKVMGIVANGYPTRSLGELHLDNKYEAYYATKMALWTYLRDTWDISRLVVNPNLTGETRVRAEAVLAAAQDIYARGAAWTSVPTPEITCTPDRDVAYEVTVNGQQYKQQVFTVWSKTWVNGLVADVAFADPSSVPSGTKLVDENNHETTRIQVSSIDDGFAGKFKVLYPLDAVEGQEGSIQLSYHLDVYQYAVFYAVCAEAKYGSYIQSYAVDTDPTKELRLSAYSNYGTTPVTPPVDPDTPDEPNDPGTNRTALRIIKYETGTSTPLSGALFEVIDPKGKSIGTFATNSDGRIDIPLLTVGNYTVYERSAPANHLLSENPAQNVTVVYDKVATVTFYNDPYGALRVEKKSNTGENLAGAVISITHIASGKTYTAATNTAGAAVFDELKPGAYRVQETAAPQGWALNDTVYTTTVMTGETTSLSIINNELPGLRIIKYDRKNYAAMVGVTFEVFCDTVSIGRFKTNQFGEIVLTNLAPGTYRAMEMDTGDDGYILDTTPQEVELTAGSGIRELVFFNDQKPGLHLIKIDAADPSKVIPNAVFEIRSVAGDYGPEEFTTDQNGEIDLSRLPAGAYVVTEKACDGYVIDDVQRIIQLDPNEDAQFIFTNHIRPSLRIVKLSADGSRLAGTTFRIARIEDGSHYLDRTTNTQGEILISDLEPGVYSVQETATAADHILDKTEYHVELFAGRTSTVTIRNDKRPNLTVYKYDADTGAPVADAVFLVETADGHSVGEIRTDTKGKGTLKNLLPGVYQVTEKSVPDVYLLDAAPQLITLYPNRDRSVYFENHQKPVLTVNKINSVTGDPIQGTKFHIWYAENNNEAGALNDLGYFYTDENGQIEIGKLKSGWYKITEVEPSPGFSIKEPDTQTVFIHGGESKSVTFENTPLSALVVSKYDSVTQKAIEGAVFQLKYLAGTSGTGGTVIGTYRTSANGSFTVTGLKAGTYIVEEIASDAGHVIDTAPQTVYLSGKDQDVVQVYFGNAPKGSLLVRKVSAGEDRAPLSDVEFRVTKADGTLVGNANGKFVTDSSGSFLVENIDPGTTLVVKETRAKTGYLLDDTPQTATVRAGQTISLEFRNQPLGNLIIEKLGRNGSTTVPLKGVKFEIRYANGKYVDTADGKQSSNGIYYTDATGKIILSGITGTVVVTELESIPGYIIDPDTRSQTVTVNPDDTQTLRFYNDAFCGIIIHKVSSTTGRGIYGAKFVLYDSSRTPIGEYSSDQDGYVYIPNIAVGKATLFYLREIESAPGYVRDDQYKTVFLSAGKTVTVEWKNTPITGQIQVRKYAAERNPITGAAAGTPLSGAVYEICDARSGRVVEYITTDARGVAASGPIPLGRYMIREVSAPAYWQLDNSVFDETLEYAGQIIRLSAYDKPAALGVTITKRGNSQVLAGTQMRYDITVANTSNVPLESFYWHDKLPYDMARAVTLTTGTYSARLNYRVLYKTNYTSNYQVLASNLLSTNNYSFALSAIPLQHGEVITDIYFDFGTVPVGFQSVASPLLTVQVSGTAVNGYLLVNRADAGGKYLGTWETTQASWITIVRNLKLPTIPTTTTLPKTGY